MTDTVKGQDTILGFLGLYETTNRDGYLGAILVTDSRGIPQEFRCTHPVKPTPIQRPLYGDMLEPYVGITLCGLPLFEALTVKPALLLVQQEYLLEMRRKCPRPVVFVRHSGAVVDVGTSANAAKAAKLESSGSRFQPITITCHHAFGDDLSAATGILQTAFESLDPVEPFDRMTKAVEMLAKQDKRFQ